MIHHKGNVTVITQKAGREKLVVGHNETVEDRQVQFQKFEET